MDTIKAKQHTCLISLAHQLGDRELINRAIEAGKYNDAVMYLLVISNCFKGERQQINELYIREQTHGKDLEYISKRGFGLSAAIALSSKLSIITAEGDRWADR